MEENKKVNNKNKNYIRNGIIFIILVWITFYVLLKDQNTGDILSVLRTAKLPFVFLAIVCMLGYFICEAINLRRTLKELGESVNIFSALKYILIGFFYSSITPAASGGQPMQIYYMHKDGIKAANSTLALILNLLSFQVVTILMAMISVIFFHRYMDAGLIALFVLGITLNSMALTLLIIGIFSKKLSTWLVNISIKIMRKLRIKNIEKKEENLMATLDKYNGSAKYIRNNKKIIIKQFIITIIQEIIYYSIPFFTYKALGLSGQSFIKIICLQSIVYATVSGIPSPGAVGVSEGAFVSIFKTIFGEQKISGAMLLNRGVSFYLFVLICCIIVIISTLKLGKKEGEAKSD